MSTESSIPPVIADLHREGLKPVSPAERVATLDVMRGFALLGILTVNMAMFSWPIDQVMMGQQAWAMRADVVADWFVRCLAEGKFYPLFSFLFGVGAALQMERAEKLGADFAGRFCRRLLVLLGIGLMHALLVWEGDILVWYALFGFVLLAFRRRKPKTILIWAVICLLIPALLITAGWALLAGLALIPELATGIAKGMAAAGEASALEAEENIRVFARGSYAEIFALRLQNLMFMWLIGCFFAPTFLGMFLVGLYAGRRRLVQEVAANRRLLRGVLIGGLAVGLPANVLYAISVANSSWEDLRFLGLLGSALVSLGGPVLGLAYAAALTLLLQREGWSDRLRPVAAAGRMALSNYLLQSLICTTIFYSYGFGLYGSVGRAEGLGLVVLIYAAQLPFSVWWLKHFRFGPAEWVWRSLTYGQRQPVRR